MTTFSDIKASLNANSAKTFRAADGTSSTDFVWLESISKWLWHDSNNGRSGATESLVLLFDDGEVDGDDLGYNQAKGLLGTDFEGNPAMWVFDGDKFDLDFDDLPESTSFKIISGDGVDFE